MAAQQIQEHVLKISKITNETPSVKIFRMGLPENTNIDFYPGQFFMVSFVDYPEIKVPRAYSIASSPLNKQYLEIGFNKVGPFTTRLFEMKEGDLLKFKGPYGKDYFSEEVKNDLVLVAGGTGITPLIGIIRYCSDKKLGNKIKLIYSVKTPDDIMYREDLDKIKKLNPNFDYAVTVTRPNAEHNWTGRTGRIGIDLLKQNIGNIENSIFYLCGPNEFVRSIIEMLENLGVKKGQIKTDAWG